MRRPLLAPIVCAVVLLAHAPPSPGATLDDAEALYQSGDFAGAESLFRRHLLEFPGEEVARFRAGQSALNRGQYIDAARDFGLVVDSAGSLAPRARYMAGVASYRLGDYTTAKSEWGETMRRVASDDTAAAAQYGRAWCSIRTHAWEEASLELGRLQLVFPSTADSQRAASLSDALREAHALPLRSPRAAKWLSTALPGTGQMYAGRAASGVVSLGLNAGFFYFLARAVSDERWVDALFIYVAGSRFYWGGRENAGKFAETRNARIREAFVSRLEREGL